MSRQLNIPNINKRLEISGLNSADLANIVGVSRTSVSNWINGTRFPKAKYLLEISKILKLGFKELVVEDQEVLPIIAFRKKANTKTTDKHYEAAIRRGHVLKNLVPFLPYDNLSQPPALIDPQTTYSYIQNATAEIRRDLNLSQLDIIKTDHLLKIFNQLHAVIIPVFWGKKNNVHSHENALHIYLPDSKTTWVYLNLEANIPDFKFWMAHELGHAKAPHLENNTGEDFSDKFAQTLLFSEEMAKKEYSLLKKEKKKLGQIHRIIEMADNLVISPYTVFKQLERYIENYNLNPLLVDKNDIGKKLNAFNSNYHQVNEYIFNSKKPKPSEYLNLGNVFRTPFFQCLQKYLTHSEKSATIICDILNIPFVDGKAIYQALMRNGPIKDSSGYKFVF
jgi:transcriptional regulator with XRE-family HTH domain